mmetsp:Transcript_106016/g.285166  ORF Transcript_106016/g.285166 Transcript_106016/m.285166 type:complete len:225 (-) Transcript_106016:130-804(-)
MSPPSVPEQILGAAAKDPAAQAAVAKAVRQAAANPAIQQAAMRAGQDAACEAAASGADVVRHECFEVRAYIQENHGSLKVFCFCIALALLTTSVLSVVNIFKVAFQPFHYLFSVYNVIFALAIAIIDGKPEWYRRCGDVQRKLFSAAPILASHLGRACFYLYVGSINLVMLPDNRLWKLIYIGIGCSLCFVGGIMIAHRFSVCKKCLKRCKNKAPHATEGTAQP